MTEATPSSHALTGGPRALRLWRTPTRCSLRAGASARSASCCVTARSCIGLAVVLLLVLAAIIGPMLTGIDPTAMRIRNRFKPPSEAFLFGTDQFGRDVLTRVLHGARLSLGDRLVGGAAVRAWSARRSAIAAGYFRRLDSLLMRVHGCAARVPCHPAGDRHQRRARSADHQRHRRARRRLRAAHRAYHPRLDPGHPRDGVHRGRAPRPAPATCGSSSATSCPTAWGRWWCS